MKIEHHRERQRYPATAISPLTGLPYYPDFPYFGETLRQEYSIHPVKKIFIMRNLSSPIRKKEIMKEITPLSLVTFAGVAVLSLLMPSCACRIPQEDNHSAYTKHPKRASSKFWRGLAKSMPFSKDAAFYGNWGGSGNKGGRPIDQLDEAFRRHDIVYYESVAGNISRLPTVRSLPGLKRSMQTRLSLMDGNIERERSNL